MKSHAVLPRWTSKSAVFLSIFLGRAAALPVGQLEIQDALSHDILGKNETTAETQTFIESHVPRIAPIQSLPEWKREAARLRRQVLDEVIFRGEAVKWRDAKTSVVWLDTIAGGPGYRIRMLRYEAVPGLWIPALLYEPDHLAGKVPVALALNGHAPEGKAVAYKQIRCINQAKRGMLVLSPEFLGMGQLATEGFRHNRLNQLDLCGTSGVAPFYLAMKRGLDLLLCLDHADPQRVVVSGLSGGGWQTILISSLDTRVRLANPVAGYASFRDRARHIRDVGDAEQAPCDLALFADYTHLTAMRAPHPTLLTYNAKDDCCFVADYALPTLLDAARPAFELFGQSTSLRYHVNYEPGTHNFELENRQAFYRLLGDFFFSEDKDFVAAEIPSSAEVKTPAQLCVPMPADNADLHSLALALSQDLPRNPVPRVPAALPKWQQANRARLRDLLRAKAYQVTAFHTGGHQTNSLAVEYWKLKIGNDWTVPAAELERGEAKETVILLSDVGRKALANQAAELLADGKRVLALDPLFFGESAASDGPQQMLLLSAVGARALGIQAGEVAAAARWLQNERHSGPVSVVAVGPRSSVFALAAAGLEEKAIGQLELHQCLPSLKQVIAQNALFDQEPELFCFGLLETFDIEQLRALVAPRSVALLQ